MKAIVSNDRAGDLHGQVLVRLKLACAVTKGLKRQLRGRDDLDFNVAIKR
jgi:hypothetical protein